MPWYDRDLGSMDRVTRPAIFRGSYAPQTNVSERVMTDQPAKTRRAVLTAATAAGVMLAALSACNTPRAQLAAEGAIRPFEVSISQSSIDDLRQRIAATRWPDSETVADRSQGAPLKSVQELLRYWGDDYDWRRAEARLNALPQFKTEIDGVDIHFIHIRSRHPNALPLIMTHGWPGSVFELLGTVGPLTDPVAYGGSAEDAFDLVLPSMPGYGFSGKPTGTE